MNYIVLDLEFNQGFNSRRGHKSIINPKCPFEIIQVGAIKLDENLQTISTLNKLVKSQIYNDINPFVKEMTGITMDLLNNAKTFKEIYEEFIQFVKDDEYILCVWGMADIKELFRNVEYYQLDKSVISTKYINLQSYTSRHLNCPKGTNIGLRNTVELLNIPVKSQFHDAFNDAYYTAEIFKKIYSKNIKPKTYNPTRSTSIRNTNEKKKIDMLKLIEQFEKMFDRKMSAEEQRIIKLAYMMGKTNQFQIEVSDTHNKQEQ